MSDQITTPFAKYPGDGTRLLGPVTGANCRRGYGLQFFQLTGIGSCAYCGTNLAGSYNAWLTIVLDHAVPESVGQALKIREDWLEDLSNRVLACGACNTFDNRYEPSFRARRPTNLKEFFTLRNRVFLDRKTRILRCHEHERAFFRKHWQRASTAGKRRE
jgi:hypothetical protein